MKDIWMDLQREETTSSGLKPHQLVGGSNILSVTVLDQYRL